MSERAKRVREHASGDEAFGAYGLVSALSSRGVRSKNLTDGEDRPVQDAELLEVRHVNLAELDGQRGLLRVPCLLLA